MRFMWKHVENHTFCAFYVKIVCFRLKKINFSTMAQKNKPFFQKAPSLSNSYGSCIPMAWGFF